MACSESKKNLLFYQQLLNEKFLSYNGEIPFQTAIYNPFSGELYYRSVYISGRQICNFLDWPRHCDGMSFARVRGQF
jgi:serine protease inhibitor ecotin